jgi:aminoglycoside phosphotransferase (APT) family kinase protein
MKFTPIERPPGDFQQSLSAQQVAAICARIFGPDAEVLSAGELPVGMFNSSYTLEIAGHPKYVLRVGPADVPSLFRHEQYLLRREQAIAPYFGPVAHLLPRAVCADFTRQIVPRDYGIQLFLEGELWDPILEELPEEVNAALWEQLGAAVHEIHQVKGDAYGFPEPMPHFATWSEAMLDFISGMYADLLRLELDATNVPEFMQLVERGSDILDEIDTPYLIHGDPWPKNVLIDRDGDRPRIVGLLDHERGMWGDPMAEWVFHLWNFPEAFWSGYGPRPDDRGAQFRALVYVCTYCIQGGFLESWRYHWDGSEVRQLMTQKLAEAQVMLG